jgi:phosphoribosylformimino-5-aminoimidazole carboxamide ribotide isomerase
LLVREPVDLTRAFASAGFRRIQAGDVDGLHERSDSIHAIEAVIRDGAVGVQVVVDDQSNDLVDRVMEAGAESVVIRASAVDDLMWVDTVAQSYPGEVLLATDVRDRRAVARGWTRELPVDVFDLIDDIAGMALAGLLVSLADGSGNVTHADFELLEDVAEACEFPVFTAMGASSMNDLRALESRGVAGVVLGSSLYSGTLSARAVAQEFGG